MELTPIFPQDHPVLQQLLTDPQIARTFLLPDYANPAEALPLVQKMQARSADPTRFVRAIRLQGQLIGFVNDTQIQDGCIELGYVIHPGQQGRGYMTQALGLAISQLFLLGYQTVKAGAFAENTASIRVMEKCGMQRQSYTDCVAYRGQTHRCVYYSISKGDLDAKI